MSREVVHALGHLQGEDCEVSGRQAAGGAVKIIVVAFGAAVSQVGLQFAVNEVLQHQENGLCWQDSKL